MKLLLLGNIALPAACRAGGVAERISGESPLGQTGAVHCLHQRDLCSPCAGESPVDCLCYIICCLQKSVLEGKNRSIYSFIEAGKDVSS